MDLSLAVGLPVGHHGEVCPEVDELLRGGLRRTELLHHLLLISLQVRGLPMGEARRISGGHRKTRQDKNKQTGSSHTRSPLFHPERTAQGQVLNYNAN